jgi:hypothetical protein
MPKLSVYVADDLWEQAREVGQGRPPSSLVQTALREFVTNGTARPPFARQRPGESGGQVARVRERLAQQARARYEAGYQDGIDLADQLSWADLDALAGLKWDLDKWWGFAETDGRVSTDQIGETEWARSYHDKDADAKRGASAIGKVLDQGFKHQAVYRTGVTDALKDVWGSISTAEGEDYTDSD